jgi:hypothetical protein
MRTLLLLLFSGIAVLGYAQQLKKVQVRIEYTNNYCGGAKPSPDVLEKSKKQYPLSLWTLKLEEEGSGKTILVKTDGKGKFAKEIPVGTYYVYLTSKINKKLKTNVNVKCKKMMAKNYGKLVIAKGQASEYSLVLHFGCDPCAPPKP